MKYDEETPSERWLILGDKDQKFPTEPLTVLSAVERKTMTGKAMPVMTLENTENGERYLICAWKRDVKACIDQYGTNTEQWGLVQFGRNSSGRPVLMPAKEQLIEEVVL